MQVCLLVRVGSPFVKGMFFHKTLMILLIKCLRNCRLAMSRQFFMAGSFWFFKTK